MSSYNTNAQDIFNSDYRLYIEGVQVPFESVNISNVYGQLPTASITLPPWPGLSELGRNYSPKINVFWRDYNYGVSEAEASAIGKGTSDLRDVQRDAYKLIFTGVIVSTVDSKSMSTGGGNQNISVSCTHELTYLNDILIRYGNQAVQAAQSQLAVNSDTSVTLAEWDINTMMIKALMGVKGDVKSDSIHYVESDKLMDLQGTPGILRVMWNALKKDANTKRSLGSSEVLTDIYIPLIEDGIKFWERMTGHPSIEGGIQDDSARLDYNNGSDNSAILGVDDDLTGKIMVPPVFRSFLGAAAQKELAITSMQSLQNGAGSPEQSSFMDHIQAILRRLEYDMVTLSAPVSKGPDGEKIYEYIVKPIIPTYYAPICNVVLPNMISDVSVNSNYDMIPTRAVNLTNLVSLVSGIVSGTAPAQSYVSPHSVRYARAGGEGSTLQNSLFSYNNVPGKYEYGSGVKAKVTQLPALYNLMKVSLESKEIKNGKDVEIVGESEYAGAVKAWDKMHLEGNWPGRDSYNPLKEESEISAFNRLNFLYSDQQFASETTKARTAQASGVFNPYAIVGYPMNLVDSVPSRESYHGLCTSVSHSIHASGQANTSYGMSGVTTFSELALYNIPSVNPYLSNALGFEDDSRLYANKTAYVKACKIYQEVFGVGAAEPALLQDYDTGEPLAFGRSGAYWVNSSSRFHETVQGSLALVARNITSLTELDAHRTKSGLSNFIDIADWIDTAPAEISSPDNVTKVEISEDRTKILTPGLDTESSPFLDY